MGSLSIRGPPACVRRPPHGPPKPPTVARSPIHADGRRSFGSFHRMSYAITETLASGFRFTQGWGSVGTILVGLLAVGTAAYWNRRTLARSDERYAADHHDAHLAKMREVVVDVAHKTTAWAHTVVEHRAQIRRTFLPGGGRPETQEDATKAEFRIREAANRQSAAQGDLRRSLWAAQLVVDDPALYQSIVDTLETQEKVRAVKYPAWDESLIESTDEMNTLMERTCAQVDGMLDYANDHLAKRSAT